MNRYLKKVGKNNYISVLQFNTLADCCAKTDSLGFPFVDPSVLDWGFREPKLEKDIFRYNPDLIALEEVDKPEVFERMFTKYGYTSTYTKSSKSNHGIMLAWKTSLFKFLDYHDLQYSFGGISQTQVAGMVNLKYIGEEWSMNITFASTHLKSKTNFRGVREAQLEQFNHFIQKHKKGGVLMAGDFNDVPDSKMIYLLGRKMEDACSKHMEYTTFKTRPSFSGEDPTEIKRIIDYIFYDKSFFTPINILGCPPHVDYPGLPSELHPSDHLSLYAKFRVL